MHMYGCESWTIKKAEHWNIDAFELWCWRLLRVPWTTRRSKPVHPKGDQACVFIRRTDVEAEAPILWPPNAKSWLIWKDPDAGKEWGQEEKGMTEDEMVGWHHKLNGHGFGWTPGVGDGQGGLVCLVHGVTKSQTRLRDWTELKDIILISISSVQVSSVAQSCPTLCDPMNCSQARQASLPSPTPRVHSDSSSH